MLPSWMRGDSLGERVDSLIWLAIFRAQAIGLAGARSLFLGSVRGGLRVGPSLRPLVTTFKEATKQALRRDE